MSSRAVPGLSKLLAAVALAASVLVGVDLAWNIHDVEPMPPAVKPATDSLQKSQERELPAKVQQLAEAARRKNIELRREADRAPAPAPALKGAEAPAAAVAAPSAPPPALSENEKIDRLLAYVGSLEGAVFLRNGDEHTPAEAVEHMKLKREKAGDRVKTADDFIKLCASRSYLSGKEYQIRFPDGRTLTSEEVLREELARLK